MRVGGVGVDITDGKLAAEAVRRLNLDLEAQVRERTAMLEAANKDLESFAYSVSHDLRTPLRSIEGFAAVLADEHRAELSGDAVDKLERIKSASRRMAQLIDDMLMLSRASRAEIRREPIDVTMILRAIVAELRALQPEREATVEIEDGLIANADTQLLRIVLVNLLGNAWKYTGRCQHAQIAVGSEIYEGESVFFVRDNGCGFDMRFVGKLFQPFQRLHANQEFEGTGVGLATVARIVRRHGGRVWAEGHLERGAVFRFTLGDRAAVNPS
jgi:signal transduction histidine kinase